MARRRVLPRGFVLLSCALLLAACAARYAPPGPGPTNPELRPQGSFVASDGLALPYRAWLPAEDRPPRAVVLALHGFNDYSKAFELPAPVFTEAGIALYAYDQRGFGAGPNPGLWAGSEAMLSDLRDAVLLLKQRYPEQRIYLLGESMGGAVAAAGLARYPDLPVEGLVLVAPAMWGRETQPWYQRWALWAALQVAPGWTPTGEDLGRQASDNIEMLRELGRDPLFIKETRIDAVAGLVDMMDAGLASAPEIERPVLLLYGAKDEIVPPEPVLRFWRDLPGETAERQRLAYYEDGWHMLLRDLQAEVPLGDIVAWIERGPGTPLPSEAEEAGYALLVESETEEGAVQ